MLVRARGVLIQDGPQVPLPAYQHRSVASDRAARLERTLLTHLDAGADRRTTNRCLAISWLNGHADARRTADIARTPPTSAVPQSECEVSPLCRPDRRIGMPTEVIGMSGAYARRTSISCRQ
jgi:hypothetical protein